MAHLQPMPEIVVSKEELRPWGKIWLSHDPHKRGDKANAFGKKDGMDFTKLFDGKVAEAMAKMLGGTEVKTPNRNDLTPPAADCVEVGDCRIIGGIRPQNYDVCYRPDGVRFVFDSKSLNDAKSLQKNYQNMINDLATEASTVHIRFPYAIVAFMVVVPEPILAAPQRNALTGTLERLSQRLTPQDSEHKAEVISLLL